MHPPDQHQHHGEPPLRAVHPPDRHHGDPHPPDQCQHHGEPPLRAVYPPDQYHGDPHPPDQHDCEQNSKQDDTAQVFVQSQ